MVLEWNAQRGQRDPERRTGRRRPASARCRRWRRSTSRWSTARSTTRSTRSMARHEPYLAQHPRTTRRIAGRGRRDGRARRARRARPGVAAPGDRRASTGSSDLARQDHADGKAKYDGVAVGAAAAAVMLADRLDDGRNGYADVRRRHATGRVAPRAAAEQQRLLVGRRGPAVRAEAARTSSGSTPPPPLKSKQYAARVQRGQGARRPDGLVRGPRPGGARELDRREPVRPREPRPSATSRRATACRPPSRPGCSR